MIPSKKKSAAIDSLAGIFAISVTAFVVALLYFAREVLIPLALAGLLTFLLAPVVMRVERWLGRIFSVLIIVAVICLVLGTLTWMLSKQVVDLAVKLPNYKVNIQDKLRAVKMPHGGDLSRLSQMINELGDELTGNHGVAEIADPENPLPPPSANKSKSSPTPVAVVSPPNANPISHVRWITSLLLKTLATGGLVMLLSVFMLLQREDIRSRLLRLAGQERIGTTTRAMDDAGRRVTRYLVMEFVVNVVFGVCVGVGLYFIGLPNATLWGAMAAVLRFVPYVGSWIAAAFPIIVALAVTPGWTAPMMALCLFAVLELITANFVEPLLYGASTGVSAVALIVAAIFWTWIWGPVGLILATPLTVCLVVIGRHVPRLAFFSIMLGDEEALSPADECYHRLIALGLNEAGNLTDSYVRENSVTALYDNVLIHALSSAELDFRRGSLEETQRNAVLQGVRDIIEELGTRPLEKQKNETGKAGVETVPVSPPPNCRVLCLAARAERDEIAGEMLTQLLRKQGFAVENASSSLLVGELPELVEKIQADVVCISVISPSTVVHARYLSTKLRERFKKLKIVVCLWGGIDDVDRAKQGLLASGSDEIVVSMAEAVVQLAKFSSPILDDMLEAPIPRDEEERLAALLRLNLLNNESEPVFNRLTKSLAHVFAAPIALVSLIDRDRQIFKAQTGLPEELAVAGDMPRAFSICAHVVGNNETMVVEDIARDCRFANNPWLKSRGFRFYAGIPLRAPGGEPIGAICIMDTQPRPFSDQDRRLLETMAEEVMMEIERNSATEVPSTPVGRAI
ncbi:MAG TPA: AI-2E family transporter [Opitutaceae bacterium]|nr:AI-2E family transporter [Opitutaceae bacterium]